MRQIELQIVQLQGLELARQISILPLKPNRKWRGETLKSTMHPTRCARMHHPALLQQRLLCSSITYMLFCTALLPCPIQPGWAWGQPGVGPHGQCGRPPDQPGRSLTSSSNHVLIVLHAPPQIQYILYCRTANHCSTAVPVAVPGYSTNTPPTPNNYDQLFCVHYMIVLWRFPLLLPIRV